MAIANLSAQRLSGSPVRPESMELEARRGALDNPSAHRGETTKSEGVTLESAIVWQDHVDGSAV